MAGNKNELDDTKRLMGALVRMRPKPHEEMKIGKKSSAKKKRKKAKNARYFRSFAGGTMYIASPE